MADTRAQRLDRIDAAIACHRQSYLKAIYAGHDGEAITHEAEVDRLPGVRHDIQRGWRMGVTA